MTRKESGFSNIGSVLLVAILMASFVAATFAADVSNTPTTQVIVGNAAPTVANVTLNGASAITLTANATTAIQVSYQITDNNGCGDIETNTAGTTTVYRSGVSGTCAVDFPSTSNLSCYTHLTRTTSSCSGNTINVTDTVGIWYFADATDASSSFSAQNWAATSFAKDLTSATGSAASAGVELNTLLAIRVTTSSINYNNGVALSASSTSGTTNSIATTTNVGNSSSTYTVRATTGLVSGANNIATSNQRWATSSFNYDAEPPAADSTSTRLTSTGVTTNQLQLSATTTAGTGGARTHWGLKVPAGTATGTYTGVNTFTSVFNP